MSATSPAVSAVPAAAKATDRLVHAGPVPIYSQIQEALVELIDRELGYDDPLPSERELAERFGVARMTARRTIDQLVREGRAYRVPGRGAYVARPQLIMPLNLRSFTADIRERGMLPGSREISRTTIPADRELAAALGLLVGDPVHVLERLRLADLEPIAVERAHLPAWRTPGLLDRDLSGSLYELLDAAYGLVIDAGEQTISATLVEPPLDELLAVPRGAPALRFERRSMSGGKMLEVAMSTYRADHYQLRATFNPGRLDVVLAGPTGSA